MIGKWSLIIVAGIISTTTPDMRAETISVTHDRQAVQAMMRQKLGFAKNIYEGMAVDDFRLIEENLLGLSTVARSATWRMLRTKEYQRYSEQFQRALEDLQTAVAEKDSLAASLPYLRLTMACLECHAHVRAKIAP